MIADQELTEICLAYEEGFEIGLQPGENIFMNGYEKDSHKYRAWMLGYTRSNKINIYNLSQELH